MSSDASAPELSDPEPSELELLDVYKRQVILVCGLGISDGLTFTIAGAHITLTRLALAAIVGILLNAVLPGNDYVFETAKKKEEMEDD